jgi:hypothetical protein
LLQNQSVSIYRKFWLLNQILMLAAGYDSLDPDFRDLVKSYSSQTFTLFLLGNALPLSFLSSSSLTKFFIMYRTLHELFFLVIELKSKEIRIRSKVFVDSICDPKTSWAFCSFSPNDNSSIVDRLMPIRIRPF